MKTPSASVLLVSLLAIGSVFADPVDETQVVDFQAGTPATAADMNQTIQELVSAINDNAAQIKALQDQWSIIASLIHQPEPTLDEDLAGSVFKLGTLEVGQGTSSVRGGNLEIGKLRGQVFGETATLTLNADHSLSMVYDGSTNETNLTVNSSFDPADPGNPYPLLIDVDVANSDFPEADTLVGTWAVANGELTLTIDGEDELYAVSPDGNTIFSNGNDAFVDGGIDMFAASMSMGVRISKPTPDIEVRIVDLIDLPGTSGYNPPNNGTAEWLSSNNPIVVLVKNNGNADLIINSSKMFQDEGGDFTFTGQTGPITVAPGVEYLGFEVHNPNDQGPRIDASIYIMCNDPDTPTFIYNLYQNGQ